MLLPSHSSYFHQGTCKNIKRKVNFSGHYEISFLPSLFLAHDLLELLFQAIMQRPRKWKQYVYGRILFPLDIHVQLNYNISLHVALNLNFPLTFT
jgi:hypothetical protein